MDRTQYGPWALIAGGSEGLGASFSEQLAADGFNLVLLGRKVEPLEETAERARKAGVEVRTLSVDLTSPDMLSQVRALTDDVEVGLLVYNAGANSYGSEFVEADLERFNLVIDVNTRARLALCHHYGKKMKDRGRGGILMVGSMAGYRGSPWNALYNAAKAFSRVFSEGLWYELKDHGVHVMEFSVGGIRTPAMAPAGHEVRARDRRARRRRPGGPGPHGRRPRVGQRAGRRDPHRRAPRELPRAAVIAEAAEALKNLGLYPPR